MTEDKRSSPPRRYEWSPRRIDRPGIALSAAIAVVAEIVCLRQHDDAIVSPVFVALLLGSLLANTGLRSRLAFSSKPDPGHADVFEPGLKYVGTWVLRGLVILMGMRVSTTDMPVGSGLLIVGVLSVTVTGSFFVAHIVGAVLSVPRALTDLVAGGTMICGASAVNAIAPGVGARREEQAIAITSLFAFSIVAIVIFPILARIIGLDNGHAGLWSGLAVNDFSSAIATGRAIGSPAEVTATMAKSARVLLLGPAAIGFRLLRGSARGGGPAAQANSSTALFPGYLRGFVALALLRNAGDGLWGSGTFLWAVACGVDAKLAEFLVVMVSAAIGMQLDLRKFLSVGLRAFAVSAATWMWTAGMSAILLLCDVHGSHRTALATGAGALLLAGLAYATVARRRESDTAREEARVDVTAAALSPRTDPFHVATVAIVALTIGAYAYTAYSRWRREHHANDVPAIREPLSPRAQALRSTVYDPRCPPGMAFIDAGRFMMGSNDHFNPDELPIHSVDVRSFCYDVTEVTVHEYLACIDAGDCSAVNNTARWPDLSESDASQWDGYCNANRRGFADHPINCVTWDQADRYCRAHGQRLPSEDEWEYVARGGSEQRRFTWGSQLPEGDLSNLCDEGCARTVLTRIRQWAPLFRGMRDPWPATAPIGSFPRGAGRWGILDQTGNVTEWTSSFYCPYPDTHCLGGDRVARGNGYLANLLLKVRAARRNHDVPWHRSPDAGFRCAGPVR